MQRSGTWSLRGKYLFLFAALFYAALAVYTTLPLAPHLRDATIYAPGDSLLTGYILRWNLHQLAHAPLHLFDATMFYPQPNTLALSENLLGLSLLFAPVEWIFHDTLLIANLVVLVSFWWLALTAFWVLRRWTGSAWLALIGGVYIGFAPPRFNSLTHLQLLCYAPTLLSLEYLRRWFRDVRGADALRFWCAVLAQFLIGVYLFEFNLVLIAVAAPLFLWFYHGRPGRGLLRKARWKRLCFQAVLGACCFAALVAPFYLRYSASRSNLFHGVTPSISTLKGAGATLLDYLQVASTNRTWLNHPWRYNNPFSDFPWENNIGFVYSLWLVLLAGGCAFSFRRRRTASLRRLWLVLAAAALLCFVLSLGPMWHIGSSGFFISPMPYVFFYKFFPGFDSLRVPPRFALPLSLLLPAVALIPLGPWWRLLSRRRPLLMHCCGAALLLACVWEHRTVPMVLSPMPPRSALPKVVTRLRKQPSGPVFFWPLAFDQPHDYVYLYYNTYNWFPLVNGRSGYLPAAQGDILNLMIQHFPQPEALARLRAIGVRYIVLAGHLEPDPQRRAAMRRQLDQLVSAGQLTRWFAAGSDAGYAFK